MSPPLVSVIMPVYNCEKYLREAIDSVLAQSYKNIELVVINDGSTDSSREIILSFSDPRIRFLENDNNSGIVFTRNKGLDSANGEFVATLDSDDVALPERLEKQVNFLSGNPDFGMCGTFFYSIDSDGKFLRKVKFPTNSRDIATFMTLGNCFCNSTVMIRSKIAKELKYREKYDIVEDYEMWWRITKSAKLTNLPFYGTRYRVHGDNISVAKMKDMFALVKKINRQILTDLNIDFSDKELEVHSNLLNRNIGFFEAESHFKELADWVPKFYKKLKAEGKYNNGMLFKLISQKWIVICFNTKRYKQLFYNRLFQLNRIRYLSILGKRVLYKLMNIELNEY
jgi:glycosyltransferase involved in cell wall biosynthesis